MGPTVREVYDQAQAYPAPDPGLPETVQRAQRVKLQQQCQKRLWSSCKPYLDRRCAHEGAVPAGGTLLAGVVRFRRRSPGERGQQRGRSAACAQRW